MTKRPILSLKKTHSPQPDKEMKVQPKKKISAKKSSKEDHDKARSKQAKIEREKKIKQAFDALLKLGLKIPISIGSGRDLVKIIREKGFSQRVAKMAISRWVKTDGYLNSVIDGVCRYHLDGSEAEKIKDKQKTYSKKIIDKRQESREKKRSDEK